MSTHDQNYLAWRLLSSESPFRLVRRTSIVSEYRDADGALGMFELNQRFTGVGALCTSLAHLPGVHFEEARGCFWLQGPNRFTFKGRCYEVTAPHDDVRIAPVEAGAAYPETDELLRLLVDYVTPKWQTRTRARFIRV